MKHMNMNATLALSIWMAILSAAIGTSAYHLGKISEQPPYVPARLSGNCGPAAQGLTPDADVVSIKVDRQGRVIVSSEARP